MLFALLMTASLAFATELHVLSDGEPLYVSVKPLEGRTAAERELKVVRKSATDSGRGNTPQVITLPAGNWWLGVSHGPVNPLILFEATFTLNGQEAATIILNPERAFSTISWTGPDLVSEKAACKRPRCKMRRRWSGKVLRGSRCKNRHRLWDGSGWS